MADSAPAQAERRDASDAILAAAEGVFADNGFDGATTRTIAEHAGVNAALIHYYFRSKEQLYEAVIARRSEAINARRKALIEGLDRRANPATLEEVLEAFLRPTVELGRDRETGGHHYARLVVHVASGTDERSRRLTRAHYDDTARLVIDAIMRAVPGLRRGDAVWGYLHGVAVALSLMARTGRAADLADGECREDDVNELIDRARIFIAAGIRAMAAGDDARDENESGPATV